MIVNITEPQDMKLWKITIAVPDDSELKKIFGVTEITDSNRNLYLAQAKVRHSSEPFIIDEAVLGGGTYELTPLIDHFTGTYKYVSSCSVKGRFSRVDTFCRVGANKSCDRERFLRHYTQTFSASDSDIAATGVSSLNGPDGFTRKYYSEDGLYLGFLPKEYICDHVLAGKDLVEGTTGVPHHGLGPDGIPDSGDEHRANWILLGEEGSDYTEYGYADSISIGFNNIHAYDATPLYSGIVPDDAHPGFYKVPKRWYRPETGLLECVPASKDIAISGYFLGINTAYYKSVESVSSDFVTDESVVSYDGYKAFNTWHYVRFKKNAFPEDSPYGRYNGRVVYKIKLEVDYSLSPDYNKNREKANNEIGLGASGQVINGGGSIVNSTYNYNGTNPALPEPYSDYVYEPAQEEISNKTKKSPLVSCWADSIRHVAVSAMSKTALTAKAVKDFVDDSFKTFADYVNKLVGSLVSYVDNSRIDSFSGTKITYAPASSESTKSVDINTKIKSGIYRVVTGDNMLKGTLPPIDDYTGYLVIFNINDTDNYIRDEYNESDKIRVRQIVYPDDGSNQSPWTRVGYAESAKDKNGTPLVGYLDSEGNTVMDVHGAPARDTMNADGVRVLPQVYGETGPKDISSSDYSQTYPLFAGTYKPNPLYISPNAVDYVSRNEEITVKWSDWSMMGGGLRRVVLTQDSVAQFNVMYESFGPYTLTLPDPANTPVGTKIGLEQHYGKGAVVCGDNTQNTEPVLYNNLPGVYKALDEDYESYIADTNSGYLGTWSGDHIVDEIKLGEACWFKLAESQTLELTTIPTQMNFTVHKGWNVIVVPYKFDVTRLLILTSARPYVLMYVDPAPSSNLWTLKPIDLTKPMDNDDLSFRPIFFRTYSHNIFGASDKGVIRIPNLSADTHSVSVPLAAGWNCIGFNKDMTVDAIRNLLPNIQTGADDGTLPIARDAKSYLFECCLDDSGTKREWLMDYDHCESNAISKLSDKVNVLGETSGRRVQYYESTISTSMTNIKLVSSEQDYAISTQFNLFYYDQYLNLVLDADKLVVTLPKIENVSDVIKVDLDITTHKAKKSLVFIDEAVDADAPDSHLEYTIPENISDKVHVTVTGYAEASADGAKTMRWGVGYYTK